MTVVQNHVQSSLYFSQNHWKSLQLFVVGFEHPSWCRSAVKKYVFSRVRSVYQDGVVW
jgi:hypothetical protein